MTYLPPHAPARNGADHAPDLAEHELGLPPCESYTPPLAVIAGALALFAVFALGLWKLAELVTRAV